MQNRLEENAHIKLQNTINDLESRHKDIVKLEQVINNEKCNIL